MQMIRLSEADLEQPVATSPPSGGGVITLRPDEIAEPDFKTTNAPPTPSMWQQANTPLLPQIHAAGKAIADFIDRPTLGVGTPVRGRFGAGEEFTSYLNGYLRGAVAGGVEGASDLLANFTSPIGLALTLAGLGPESRVVQAVPLLKPLLELPAVRGLQRVVQAGAGAAFATHGAGQAVTAPTWGGKALGVGEAAVGALGLTPELNAAKTAYTAARRTRQGAEAAHAFQLAIPPSKTTPYAPEDVHAAMPWLDVEHAQTPITSVEGLRDAADIAITRIEDHISQAIGANPNDLIRNQPLAAVKNALRRFTRSDAMSAGLKDVESFGLDQPLTVERADQIRRDLNAENKAVLKRNTYDIATARAVDPGFAAREAASQALRDGIYQQLEARGIQGVRELRQDEGSLIQVRNAADRQIYAGEKTVAKSAPASRSRDIGAMAIRAIPAPAVLHEAAVHVIKPPSLTRDALVEKAFTLRQPASAPTLPTIPPGPQIRGLLGTGPMITPPPADISGGRLVPAKKALPIRDPQTGEWKTVWLSDADYEAALKTLKR